MSASPIRSVAFALGMAALATVGAGCYAEVEGPVYAEGYQGQEPVQEPAGARDS